MNNRIDAPISHPPAVFPATARTVRATAPVAQLILEDGAVFRGTLFGDCRPAAGEVVFNTGMVGYPEALTDPSYRGQILVLTYPLVGNYGVPRAAGNGVPEHFESSRLQVSGLIVSEACGGYNHWSAERALGEWLGTEGVPGIAGLDTRALTKRLREHGTMLGKIIPSGCDDIDCADPNATNLVSDVSVAEPVIYRGGSKRVVLVDCGCKAGILRNLLARHLTVIRVPWDFDFLAEDFDGVVISNGPGDPEMCQATIAHLRRAISLNRPIFGICLGHQLLALAAGAQTYKLKYGHRGQNQPCLEIGSSRCYITAQNHGYAVDDATLPRDWQASFVNANDGTNEGLRHSTRPFMSVQFHPEGAPGPCDTAHLFDRFVELL
jgi:carbamoyl-phosphate synthase small subunit